MKHIKSILVITGFFIIFYSCDKEKAIYYDNKARIYFARDSMAYNFGYEPANITSKVFKVPVRIMGIPVPRERSAGIEVVSAKTTAKTPSDFKVPPEVKVPADSVATYVPLTLYRNNLGDKDTLHVVLRIVTTDDFDTGAIELQETKISFDNRLIKPLWWSRVAYWLGTYKREKYQKFIDINGSPVTSFYPDKIILLQQFKAVKEYFEAHPEEGITFPDVIWPV